MIQNRRQFITTAAMAGVAVPFASSPLLSKIPFQRKTYSVRLFSKPLDGFETSFILDCVSEAGIGGLDLTVRPGGKIEPAFVETQLPDFIEQSAKRGLKTDMIVTGILSASDPLTEKILKTASLSGIGHYRPGWMNYDLKAGIRESLAKFRSELVGIDRLNRLYKINCSYQNHSGAMIGSPLWDLEELMRDFSPEFTGIQYDVRHAIVEGSNSWILGLNLLSKRISTLAIKDFIWKVVDGESSADSVPLGEGMVDWDLFFGMVRDLGIVCPITLHIEYPLFEKGEENLPKSAQKEIIVRKLKKDYDFLSSYLLRYGLT